MKSLATELLKALEKSNPGKIENSAPVIIYEMGQPLPAPEGTPDAVFYIPDNHRD